MRVPGHQNGHQEPYGPPGFGHSSSAGDKQEEPRLVLQGAREGRDFYVLFISVSLAPRKVPSTFIKLNEFKRKNHIIISIDSKEVFLKIQCIVIIKKKSKQLVIEWKFLTPEINKPL